MGITLRDQGDLRRAAIAYQHALKAASELLGGAQQSGRRPAPIQGRLDEAVTEYLEAKRPRPPGSQHPQQPGKHVLRQERFDRAITEFQDLYRQNPEWEGGHSCLHAPYGEAQLRRPPLTNCGRRFARTRRSRRASRSRTGPASCRQRPGGPCTSCKVAVSINPDSALATTTWGTALVEYATTGRGLEKAVPPRYSGWRPAPRTTIPLAACLMAPQPLRGGPGGTPKPPLAWIPARISTARRMQKCPADPPPQK